MAQSLVAASSGEPFVQVYESRRKANKSSFYTQKLTIVGPLS
jgi:hypothetical protein